MTDTPILDSAKKLVTGDRAKQWGSAMESFCRIAIFWEAIFGVKITPRQVALAMQALKLSRAVGTSKAGISDPDSFADAAGYAELAFSIPPEIEDRKWLIEREPYTF